MVRRSSISSITGFNKGAWTALEDKTLTDYVKSNGEGKWTNVAKRTGLKRCGKSCRLRWMNYLRPDIKRGNISDDEQELIVRLHKLLGNRWSLIAGRLPGRTDNEIKNYWNTNLAKRAIDGQLTRAKILGQQPINVPKMTVVAATPASWENQHIICQGNSIIPHQLPAQNNESKVTIGASTECDVYGDKNSSIFLMDFSIEDICKILDLGDEAIPDLNAEIQGGNGEVSNPGGDSTVVLSDEVKENWSGSECVKGSIETDFTSLDSFFDSHEWLETVKINAC